ncbi:hypothetical protein FDN13_11950 [Caloramator sp. E03]|uniref:hypothetical protein n=1 Tax=Caloramator sp. E03 TaxID=2576307 RepID=UPI0011106941|nr:hypothetical protein [Caloramator sp. E03]QCX34357.1 hypothetical protein FDN13_11950 [Caloramator sp. E03]
MKKIIFLFLIIIIMPAVLAFSKGGYKYIPKSDPTDAIDKIETAYMLGGNIEISQSDINNILGQLVEKRFNSGRISIQDVCFYINNNKLNIILKSKYNGITFYPGISANLEYNDEGLVISISSAKIGYFPIPKFVINKFVNEYSNDYIKIQKNKILITKSIIPLNLNNLYINDNKIVLEIKKNIISKQYYNNNINQQTENKSNNNLNKQVKTDNNISVQNKNNINTVEPEYKKYLAEVSSQINGAILEVKTSKEKEILKNIQRVISEVSKNPSYPYKTEVDKVKSYYNNLSNEEKNRIKKAIINNVDIGNVLRLINIFGV